MSHFFGRRSSDQGLGGRSVRGAAFSVIGRAAVGLAQFGSILILARLLSPEEYGLVAMAIAITGFAQLLVDLGTRDVIVQQENITEPEVSALFWINLAVGLGFAVLITAAGPAISAFYREPRLTMIVAASSTSFIFASLGSQHQALLQRAGMFRELAMIEAAATVASIILSVGLAVGGFGYWALTARQASFFAFLSAGMWWYCRWLPAKPAFTRNVRSMIRQGMNLVGYSLSEYFGRSAQRVAIGRGVGARVLGLYQNALQIYENIFMLLISSLHSVAVSGLSKLIDDPREFKRAWANGLSMVAFYAMPIYGALAVTGQDLVVILLGPKWSDSGYLLSIFAVRGIPQALLATTGWLYVSSARTDRWMRWGWFASLTQLVALLIAIPFGTNVIAAAYSASMIILLLPGLAYAGKPLGLKISDYVAVVWQPFTACAVATVCCLCLRIAVLSHSTHLARFSFLVTSYAIVYLLVAVGVLRVFKPLQILRSLLRDAVPRLFPRPAAN